MTSFAIQNRLKKKFQRDDEVFVMTDGTIVILSILNSNCIKKICEVMTEILDEMFLMKKKSQPPPVLNVFSLLVNRNIQDIDLHPDTTKRM